MSGDYYLGKGRWGGSVVHRQVGGMGVAEGVVHRQVGGMGVAEGVVQRQSQDKVSVTKSSQGVSAKGQYEVSMTKPIHSVNDKIKPTYQ